MRSVILATLALAATSTPGLAQSQSQEKLERAGDLLSSPLTQRVAAAQVRRLMDALLDTRIEPFARAIEPLDGGRALDRFEGETLRDMAERDDPYFEERIDRGTRKAVGSAGALAKGLAGAMPELERAMRRIEEALPTRR